MKNIFYIFLILVVINTLTCCNYGPTVNKPMETEINNGMEIRSITLKYLLLDTLYEIYQANVLCPEKYQEYYSSENEIEKRHYEWLIKTYDLFTYQNKLELKNIFENIHVWKLLNISTLTADNSNIDDLIVLIKSSSGISKETKTSLLNLMPVFYDEFFKEYFQGNIEYYNTKTDKFNDNLADYPNPFEIIEKETGMNLGKYSSLFYFTFRKVGAYGFTHGNLKISTIQGNITEVEHIMSTALHEFSHSFFQKFTDDAGFKDLSERLKSVKEFYEYWEKNSSLKSSYSWNAFCEENLVEGFAKFLGEKFYDIKGRRETYIYDADFYEYLKEIGYSPDKYNFKETSINFYEKRILGN